MDRSVPLAFMCPGDAACINSVRGSGEVRRHLENLGFVQGAFVKVINELAGNLVVEVKGSQVALDKVSAQKILAA